MRKQTYVWPILIVVAIAGGLSAHAAPQGESGESDDPHRPKAGVVPFDGEEAARLQDAWARYLSAEKVVTNTIGMPLVLIPPGKFRMEGAEHTLADPYYLGRTEVTQAQWSEVMGTTPWKGKVADGPNRPATFVSWEDAKAFCERLTERELRGTYRLPTEAGWEYACRAGTSTRFSFGDDASELGRHAWISDNTKKAGEPYAHDVGLKEPNPFDLFDMHGNVWEFCAGAYTKDRDKEERPRPARTGPMRVVAGGSWDADLSEAYPGSGPDFYCRSEGRMWPVPTSRSGAMGFRVAWTPPANTE
jgi:formylglycine-generating enzyme required for sulfatase activity